MSRRRNSSNKTISRDPVTRGKLVSVYLGFLVIASYVMFRLVTLQIINHEEYASNAENQVLGTESIPAARGTIRDVNGKILAVTLSNCFEVTAHPNLIKEDEKSEFIDTLSTVLRISKQELRKRLNQHPKFVYIDKSLRVDLESDSLLRGLEKKYSPALALRQVFDRDYPNGRIAAQITGFANYEGEGITGIEGVFNDVLMGIPGEEVVVKDALGYEIDLPDLPKRPALPGGKISLTIDVDVQAIVEEELARGVEESASVGGMAIITEPRTGAILSMCSFPYYDPKDYGKYSTKARKNRVVTDAFEAGSVLKIVPFAALLQTKRISVYDLVFCENGRWKIADRFIRDSSPHAYLTARDVLVFSSNIGTAKLTENLSNKELFTWMRSFGFNAETGVPQYGEAEGLLLNPSDWSLVTKANLSMGHAISVSTLQIAMAYGAVANGGDLMEPLLVKEIVSPQGDVQEFKPQRVRNCMQPSTARALRMLLTEAVDRGTGTRAKIENVSVAGKTGTAQLVNLKKGGYYQDRYVSSFAGFLPADQPELLGVIVLEDPQNQYYGGTVAAPVFNRIMKRLLVSMSDRFTEEEAAKWASREKDHVILPEFVNMPKTLVEERINQLGLHVRYEEKGKFVLAQGVPEGSMVCEGDTIVLRLGESIPQLAEVKVPDVRQKTLREAIRLLSAAGVQPEIKGEGVVQFQHPPPGTMIKRGNSCTITATLKKGRDT
ncbi:PASTA domain-containing protein [bacterium]|nr:PASTA domain-containing protein [bacterium]